jgi:hypothetical protein
MAAWWRRRRVERRPAEVRLAGRVLYLVDDAGLMRAQLEGHDLDPAGDLPLRHDLSTDEITPARFCYHFDRTLAEFPYTGMRAGGRLRSRRARAQWRIRRVGRRAAAGRVVARGGAVR